MPLILKITSFLASFLIIVQKSDLSYLQPFLRSVGFFYLFFDRSKQVDVFQLIEESLHLNFFAHFFLFLNITNFEMKLESDQMVL